MKKIYSMMLVAAAAMAFVSCQKQENFAPEVSTEEVVLTFASEKPAFDDETKTEWTGETIQWSAGDKISVAYTVAGNWQNASGDADGNAKIYQSNPISEAASVANFSVPTSFTGGTAGTHVFYAVYPALGDNNFPSAPVANISISPNQNPKANSFDSSADVMVGVSGEYDVRPNTNETISLKWDRLVAHAVITLKNINGLTAEESLKYITLTAQADANLVGQQNVNLIEKTIVKDEDNDAANILKLSADKLSVSDGTVTFWACVLPETITSLTVEVETDKATYTREITGISKEFKKNARNILAVNMEKAVRVENAVDNNVTDVLTRATTGVTGTSYSSWEGKTLTSGAVYAGQSAGDHESIQLRSNNSNSGVISTTSGGYAKKVVVTWNSNTASGRTLNIYGSNTAYTNPTELYNNNTRGTLLGTIVCGTSVELDVEGDYEYIGMRSASGAMYLERIEISWTPAAPKENYLEVSTNAIEVGYDETTASFTVNSDLEWTASSDNATVSREENTVRVSFDANGDTEEKTYTVTVSASGVEPQVVTITQAAYVDPSIVEKKTIAEFKALTDGDTIYELEGRISQIAEAYDSQYNNISFYIVDETTGDEIQIYRMSCVGVTEPATSITVGDRITVRGAKGSYGGQSQMAKGGTYVSHEDGAATPKIVCVDNTVTITADAGAAIYYTTDGQIPTTSSTPYNGGFPITETKTVKAIAVVDGLLQSLVASVECEYVNPEAPQPITVEVSVLGTTGTLASGNGSISWTVDDFTVTNVKGSTAIRTSDSAHYRVYQNSTLKFTASDKTISKVVITCTSGSYANVFSSSTITGGTASVSGSVVTITATGSVSEISVKASAQTRINKVVATLN